MKKILITRHGEAIPPSKDISDFNRELTLRGKKYIDHKGRTLSESAFKPQLILHSPAVRTEETARLLQGLLNVPRMEARDTLYNASADQIRKEIESVEADINNLIIVGHNPGISKFADQVCVNELPAFSPGNMAMIELDIDAWAEISGAGGKLLHFLG